MTTMLFPMETLRVTQGYGVACEGVPADTYSHAGSYALDLGGADAGGDWLFAPCDMTVVRVYGPYNAVWFLTDDVVRQAGSRVLMLCLHINQSDFEALGLRMGRHFALGERCYREGRAGNVTGTHVHIELGRAPFRGTGWHKNAQGVWGINDPLIPHEILRLARDVKIADGHGYAWQRYDYGRVAGEAAPEKPDGAPQKAAAEKADGQASPDGENASPQKEIVPVGVRRLTIGPMSRDNRISLETLLREKDISPRRDGTLRIAATGQDYGAFLALAEEKRITPEESCTLTCGASGLDYAAITARARALGLSVREE